MSDFSRRILYLELEESADYGWLLMRFPPDYHAQLRYYLFDGLCSGVFSILYGDCRNGFWCRNKLCANDRLIKFLNDPDQSPMFPEEVYERTFADPEKLKGLPSRFKMDVRLGAETGVEVNTTVIPSRCNNALPRKITFEKWQDQCLAETPARLMPTQETRKKHRKKKHQRLSPERHSRFSSNSMLILKESKNLDKSRQAKSWNDDIARDLQAELDRLRKLHFDIGLDGVDRGALK